ncbi:hypothetical protein NH340_JMT06204 [Sarcoptes scabiei]|nr:hypothetical protein NH340_JMT06204 [Sarcoptes scabiei]
MFDQICLKNHHHQFTLDETGEKITFIYVPFLKLFIISDVDGCGPNWFQVKYFQKIYDIKSIFGSDLNDEYSAIVRFLSEPVVAFYLSKSNDQVLGDEINLQFSISLRNKNPSTIRAIRDEFIKYFQQ